MSTQDNENQNINIEEITTDELLEQIEEDKRQVKKSSIVAFAALIAIIALCIAWFVMNTFVKGTSSSVSADDSNSFMLASVGDRPKAELDHLKGEDRNNLLFGGSSKTYDKYIDIKSGKPISETQTYYTGTSSLAWHMNGTSNSFAPGSSGKLEFYLIPKVSGLSSAEISLDTTGYALASNSESAGKVDEEKVQKLIDGHILLFQNLDDTYGYTGWLGEEPTLEVNAPDNGTFTKNIPYKVTIYWVWPRYFRNYIYTQRSTQEDLFTDKISQEDYTEIVTFVNDQRDIASSKLFYDVTGTAKIEAEINNQMSDTTLDLCIKYYNQADEFIGQNARYIYVEMKVD